MEINKSCLVCGYIPALYLDNQGQKKVKNGYYCDEHYLEIITTDWDKDYGDE